MILTELHEAILGCLKNRGGWATPDQLSAELGKPLLEINLSLDGLDIHEMIEKVRVGERNAYRLPSTAAKPFEFEPEQAGRPPKIRRPRKVVAEQRAMPAPAAVTKALDVLGERMKPVADLPLKVATLDRLAAIMDRSIADVLIDARNDLLRIGGAA